MKEQGTGLARPSGRPGFWLRRGAAILGFMLLPLILGAWQDITGNTINPHFVDRIKDGQTSRHEILLWFGDPKETHRTADGMVMKYFSYKDTPLEVKREKAKVPPAQSSSPYFLDQDKKIKKVPTKTAGKILHSTLTIRFKPDGETVMSHEYKEEK